MRLILLSLLPVVGRRPATSGAIRPDDPRLRVANDLMVTAWLRTLEYLQEKWTSILLNPPPDIEAAAD